MHGNCSVAALTGGLLLLALGVPAVAADAPPQLQAIPSTTEVHAPDFSPSPDDYKRQQVVASEVLTIHVTSVTTQPASTENHTPGALLVTAQAAVTGVVRSAANLTVGSTLYILYGYVPSAPGAPAPPPVPVLIKNGDYRAYLTGSPDKRSFTPAAGAQSFIDPAQADASSSASAAGPATKPNAPLADPSLLPTPDFPNPPGSVRLRGNPLDQFVRLIQHDGQWTVSIAESDVIPLQTLSGAKPVLLVFYSAPLRAPITQPSVLIYEAGVQPAVPPAKGNVTIERALLVDGNHHALGDALWAQRVENNQRAIMLPLWHWAEYKVDVEDPVTHKMQTILFTGAPAAATSKN